VAEMEAKHLPKEVKQGMAHQMLWVISQYWFEAGSCRTPKQLLKIRLKSEKWDKKTRTIRKMKTNIVSG
jgi:hypothetical protein